MFPLNLLSAAQIERIYAIRQEFFTPVPRARFETDLREKEWIILLTDAKGEIRGYSTLMRIDSEYQGERVAALFSGETITHPDYWGQAELPRVWARHVLHMAGLEGDARLYWLLTTSSYRTYRFLPLFFKEFHPSRRGTESPAIRGLLDHLGAQFFGEYYCPGDGIVRLPGAAHIRADLAEAPPQRLKDPDVACFFEKNPGWASGEELACLAEISVHNLSPAGRRVAGIRLND